VGGIPEIIENEKTGLLVPVDDISGFANAITALIKDQEERSRLGTGLHESVLKNFSKSAMLEETLSLYSSN
jgi:starch synthase